MAVKEQHLALSSGIALAGHAVTLFWEYGDEALDVFKEEIVNAVIKPNKKTAVHYYLSFFQDIYEEVHSLKNNVDLKFVYEHILRTLKDVNLNPDLPLVNDSVCDSDCLHEDCFNTAVIQKWIDYSNLNSELIDDLIVHSAFQIIFQDRNFLRDFHIILAELIKDELDKLILSSYPDYVSDRRKIKRQYFPSWLKKLFSIEIKGHVLCVDVIYLVY